MSQPYTPHEYQIQAIKFVIGRATAGLFLDPGLGKTSIVYAAFKALRQQKILSKMLVIAPLRPAHSVWPAEAKKWDDFSDLKVVVLHGDKKDALLRSDADVYVINPEGLDWLFRKVNGKAIFWDMLVVDESTRFKHATTQRFRTLRPWITYFKRRYILTGSPAPNGLLDLFGQIFILDCGHTLGRYISNYRDKYFSTGYDGFSWVPNPGAPEKIYESLKPLVLRMDGRDLLDMPPLIGVDPPLVTEVELPAKAKKVYDQMEKLLLADLDKKIVTAANAAVSSGKCRQIANGGIFHNLDGTKEKTWTDLHVEKIDAVKELVEELQGTPALVAYEYEHDLARLRKAFPDAPYIGGGVTTRRFKEIEEAWNAGFIPVLLAQPQSVAHGLNLQGTSGHVIWHSLTWNLEDYQQLIQRVWRQGQKRKVFVHHVVARGTIDELILQTLRRKERTQQDLLLALKDHLYKKHKRKAA